MGVITYWGPPLSIHQNSKSNINNNRRKKKRTYTAPEKGIICNVQDNRRMQPNRNSKGKTMLSFDGRRATDYTHMDEKKKCNVFGRANIYAYTHIDTL